MLLFVTGAMAMSRPLDYTPSNSYFLPASSSLVFSEFQRD